MGKFDAYEFLGVIIPGAVVVLAYALSNPSFASIVERQTSLGDLGIFLVASMIAGHLIQAAGNIIEAIVWSPFGGMPTKWVGRERAGLVTDAQLKRLREAVKTDFDAELSDLSAGRGLVREINACVRHKGKSDRLEAFNRQYGLLRGLASALLLAALLVALRPAIDWHLIGLLIGAALIAAFRMFRFGEHYARELFVEYLQCRGKTSTAASSGKVAE